MHIIYSLFQLLRRDNLFFIVDMAEILSKKEIDGQNIYYIHYDDCKCKSTSSSDKTKSFIHYGFQDYECDRPYFEITDNKRLDEWVGEDRMDLDKLEQPKKEVKTPSKDGKMLNGSRPSSPEREVVVCILEHNLGSTLSFDILQYIVVGNIKNNLTVFHLQNL